MIKIRMEIKKLKVRGRVTTVLLVINISINEEQQNYK